MQAWITIVLVMGGALAGSCGGGMEGPLMPTAGTGLVTLKGLLVVAGGVAAFAGGSFLLFVRDEAPALLARAAELERDARRFLDQRDGLTLRLELLAALDRKRLALIEANKVMRETLEQALLVPESDVIGTVALMLHAAQRLLTTSIGFGADEQWALSIFQVVGRGEQAELRRIACARADRLAEQNQPRSWRRNEGFVGRAWTTEEAVIIPDGLRPDALDQFSVPEHKRRTYDPDRYRSMAAIPIRIGADPCEIWGVVAASTDCPNRFRRDPGNKQVQAVDTVRLVARMAGLMAAAFRRSGQ